MIEQLTYIHRQLDQRGDLVDYEQLVNMKVRGDTDKERWIDAENQFYFLMNAATLPPGTTIISDSNSIVIEGANAPADLVEEFSGRIHIKLPDTDASGNLITKQDVFNFLFYHIIPK